MSKTKWTGALNFLDVEQLEADGDAEQVRLPFMHFSVTGGPKRLLDLRSSGDLSIGSELEQARRFNNIRIYVPSKSKYFALENRLKEKFDSKIEIEFSAQISGEVNGKLTQSVLISSSQALISEVPHRVPDAKGHQYLLIMFSFDHCYLSHTSINKGVRDSEEW